MNDLSISILTGLSIGFLGSFHCIGMCGPIALSLPVHAYSGVKKYSSMAFYNLGRAFTYGLLGLLFGWLGSQFRLWGLQQAVSITAGILILVFILSRFSFTSRIRWLGSLNRMVSQALNRLLQSPKYPASILPIGLLNGLLPCGLVYVAIAGAVATTGVLKGATLMFSFGLGTFPVMAALMVFGNLISVPLRHKINQSVPYFIGIMALVLILRGLNLGIPYVSPKLEKRTSQVEMCHKPG